VQAQILNLLEEMKARYGLTMVFIAHDLAVVRNVSDRVAVMYLGKMCEIGPTEALFAQPVHPYTSGLLDAIPRLDAAEAEQHATLAGEIPSPLDPPSGCRFRTRCPRAESRCAEIEPQLRPLADDPQHFVACHFPLRAAVGDGPPTPPPVR
jgi:peptide/nickel transport system ATP-binding protein